MADHQFPLGSKVMNNLTGFTGIVEQVVYYIDGSSQVRVLSERPGADGQLVQEWFFPNQIEAV